jgi:hypothetical protein
VRTEGGRSRRFLAPNPVMTTKSRAGFPVSKPPRPPKFDRSESAATFTPRSHGPQRRLRHLSGSRTA